MSRVSIFDDEEYESFIITSDEDEHEPEHNITPSSGGRKPIRRLLRRRGAVRMSEEEKNTKIHRRSMAPRKFPGNPAKEMTPAGQSASRFPSSQPQSNGVATTAITKASWSGRLAAAISLRAVKPSEIKSITTSTTCSKKSHQSSFKESKAASCSSSLAEPQDPSCPPTPPREPDEEANLMALARGVSLRDKLPSGQTTSLLDDVIPSVPVDPLERALYNWSDARRQVCRLGMHRQSCDWQHICFDAIFKPIIVLANEADVYVAAFRASPYSPLASRYGLGEKEEEQPEFKALSGDEEVDLIKCLREIARVLRRVTEASSCGGAERYTRLFELQANGPALQVHIKEKTERLRIALARRDIAAESPQGADKAFGALKVPQELESSSSGRSSTSLEAKWSRVSSWLKDMAVCCESDPTASSTPLKVILHYRRLKHQFSNVPICVAAPYSIVEDTGPIEAWVLEWHEEKLTAAQGKILLDEEDRANISKAIATYEELRSDLSKRGSDDVAILCHKITTRIKLYEARLRGITHMLPITIPMTITAISDGPVLAEPSEGASPPVPAAADTVHAPIFERSGGYLQVGEKNALPHIDDVWQGGNANGSMKPHE